MPEQESQACRNGSANDGLPTDVEPGLAELMEQLRVLPSSFAHGTAVPAPPAAPSAPLVSQPPQQLGPYELLEEIADDAAARTFKAWDHVAERFVTLRLTCLSQPENLGANDRFSPTCETAAMLNDPGVIPVHDAGTEGSWSFVATEFQDSESLAERLRRGPVAFGQAARIVETVARTLASAHRQGAVHVRLSPARIWVDLGSSQAPYRLSGADLMAAAGEHSMLPNCAAVSRSGNSSERPSPALDIRDLGNVLYWLLTGRSLPVDQTTLKLPRTINPDIPRDLETICLKCLAVRPVDRYATADELATDLNRFQQRQPIRTSRRAALRGLMQDTSERGILTRACVRFLNRLFGR